MIPQRLKSDLLVHPCISGGHDVFLSSKLSTIGGDGIDPSGPAAGVMVISKLDQGRQCWYL